MTKDMRNLLDAITWDHSAPEKTTEVITESAESVPDEAPEFIEESAVSADPLEEAMRNEYVAFMESQDEPVDEAVSPLIASREEALKRSEERRRAKSLSAQPKPAAKS